jgi:hypothetical protein
MLMNALDENGKEIGIQRAEIQRLRAQVSLLKGMGGGGGGSITEGIVFYVCDYSFNAVRRGELCFSIWGSFFIASSELLYRRWLVACIAFPIFLVLLTCL